MINRRICPNKECSEECGHKKEHELIDLCDRDVVGCPRCIFVFIKEEEMEI